ncbi:MAG: tripartite tricarboxylate transporter substrate binding protein [Proteobacteria bacterium]|nr:tripartite tricarboxylate transporter substrate binding protein [Burkholderiales bacterium]
MTFRVPSPAFALVVLATSLMPTQLAAQGFPARPLNLVVTVTAGGSIDAVARLIAADLGPALGQPVLVVNRPGAGGNVAGESVARAAPDGHTLMISSSSTLTVNPHVYKSVPFDSVKSFTPIVMPARLNLILAVHPRHAVSTVKEFVDLLKAQPGNLKYGSSGNGTNPQLAGILFGMQTSTSALHVPFSGIAPALNALLAGQVDYMFDSATSVPHVHAGKVKALAVVGPARLPSLPSVPTLGELGFPDMTMVNGFYAVVSTAGAPADVVTRLNTEIVRIMRQPTVMDRVSAMGLVNTTSTPEQLGQAISDDLRRLGPIIRDAKISVQ